MKNTLMDLNNHLFAQLERLSDEDTQGAELEAEIERSKGVIGISKEIVSNATLALKAEEFRSECGLVGKNNLPKMLENKDD